MAVTEDTTPTHETAPTRETTPRSPAGRRHVAAPLQDLVRTLESDQALGRHADNLARASRPLDAGQFAALLRGDVIGHALHPAMTDLPLGCWTSASVLDLLGGRAARPAARRLVALGLLGSLPTALTGLAEFHTIGDSSARRVATVHAGGNAVVMALQLLSWRVRRRDHHLRGAVWSLAGGAGALVTGYLGGHLLSARGEGIGARGTPAQDRDGVAPTEGTDGDTELLDTAEASALLSTTEEQIRVMVDEGLLTPHEQHATGAVRFRSSDVEAARLLGG
jgi:uncharacterized membrane protein